jgi:hypothetical protein
MLGLDSSQLFCSEHNVDRTRRSKSNDSEAKEDLILIGYNPYVPRITDSTCDD